MRNNSFIFPLVVAFALWLTACDTPEYVATRPVYVEQTRPPSPGPNYFWISNEWRYQPQQRIYVQRPSVWVVQPPRRTYQPGYWQTNGRGHRWINGRWH